MSNLLKLMKNNTSNIMQFYYNNKKIKKTFAEIYDDSAKLYFYLKEKGLNYGDRIGACSDNCYELILLDIASMMGGFHYIPFHKSQMQSDFGKTIDEFKVKMFFIEDDLVNKSTNHAGIPLQEIANILQSNTNIPSNQITLNSYKPNDQFTTVFTSGTTGTSKAFIIRYKSLEHFVNLCYEKYKIVKDDKMILFLPLSQFSSRSYIFAAILYRFDFVLTDVKYLIKALRLYKPTLLQGVPFFYNNLYEAFMAGIKSSYFKYTLFLAYKWCLRGVLTDSLNKKLQKKIFKGVYDFWGGRMRLLLTGAASSRKDVLDFFDIIGIPLYEVYGLVETGLITMNTLDSKKIGSVGKFLPHMDYKFAEDGELFVKSEYCWAEKYINCSIEENKKTFNEDGYISTGDIGYVDEDNFLYLKGRKKDIMVLMNGNNIHPVFLENELNGSPFIKQSAIYGNGKPFLVAVIVSENKDITKEMIKLEIKKANELINGKGEIKDFIIVNEPFSIENKLMNENMKINKNNIYRKYNIELEDLYE